MTTLAWTSSRVREAWRLPLATLAALLLLILLVYRETGVAMVTIWIRSETFTHAFVVPPISLWLIWRKRQLLAPLQPRAMPWMLLPMACLALLWWLGHLVNVAAAMQLALVAMLVASVALVLGGQVFRTLAFPLLFLFFSVPIGEFLTPTLMHWTAEALVAGLRATGIPVYQEGQQLVIPSGRWAVVAACSGIRYLMATFMVGSLFAYLNYSSNRKRLVFVAVSLVLPVVANWVRAYIIVMLGHLSNNEIATGVDHLVYGWVFFGVVILGLFFIGARWADPEPEPGAAGASGPVRHLDAGGSAPSGWRPAALALAAALVLLWPRWIGPQDVTAATAAPVALELPARLGSWQAEPLTAGEWAPHFPTATVRRQALYAAQGGAVEVHLAYYRGQRGDVKLVGSQNTFVDTEDARWHVVSDGPITAGAGQQPVTWREATIQSSNPESSSSIARRRLTVWRLYWLGGPVAHGDAQAKLLQAWQALHGQPDDGAAIHLVSTLPDETAARRQLSAFVAENYSALLQALAQARESR